jgi:cytochrome P450 / NADPH-cytochrome P450 reductase
VTTDVHNRRSEWPDLIHPDTFADGIPHDLLAQARSQAPVIWVDEPAAGAFEGGPGFWAVLRHADISHVSRHPELFSSWERTAFLRDPRPQDLPVLRRMMLHMDPPQHSKLRKIVNKAFTPQAIRKQLASLIDDHARSVVDAICERGEIDFLTDVAAEMPLLVLADILGAPHEDRGLLYDWTNRLVGIDDPDYGGDPKVYISAFMEMFAYARRQTEAKRTQPTDDLWSTIANAEVDGDRLSADDLDRFFQLLMVAGNETTRNLIAGGMVLLHDNPDQFDMLKRDLSLLPGAIEEMLRCTTPVIQFRRTAVQDTEIAGQPIAAGEKVVIVYASANRDETVFEEPNRFDITRDPNPHISFGDGTHFCLGANLARLEARVLFTELFTRLPDLHLSGPYERMRSSFIHGFKHMPAAFTPTTAARQAAPAAEVGARSVVATQAVQSPAPTAHRHDTPLLVLYGSNFGTAEDVAEQLARDAEARGFATTVAALDERVDALPTDGAVLITSSTYNGTPPDNAKKFHDWITTTTSSQQGRKFAVFGCGDSDWAATFQQVPKLIDERLAALGATCIHPRGEGDASGDFDAQLQSWTKPLWPALADALGVDIAEPAVSAEPRFTIEVVRGERHSPFVESLSAYPVTVEVNRELVRVTQQDLPARSVRHIELRLPEGVAYEAGDHLGVIPHNSQAQVQRVANRFGLEPNSVIKLHASADTKTFLPVGERISVHSLLADYVELAQVASRRDIAAMLRYTEYPSTRAKLERLLDEDGDAFRTHVIAGRRSVIDLLEEHPACALPFNVYLEMTPALSPRYYSISSSAKVSPTTCSITVGVLNGPARSGRGTFDGVCSSYLGGRERDQVVHAFVRETGSKFRLPADPATPLIMIGAGTGIAPLRGFLQERAALAEQGVDLGAAMLIFGCRHPQHDQLYADEIRSYEQAGVVRQACAYSRLPEEPRMYVQDRLRALGEEIHTLLASRAVVYVCGASTMAEGVRTALEDIHRTYSGATEHEAQLWLKELEADGRYLVDVWASE